MRGTLWPESPQTATAAQPVAPLRAHRVMGKASQSLRASQTHAQELRTLRPLGDCGQRPRAMPLCLGPPARPLITLLFTFE